MKKYQTIEYEEKESIFTIFLNRPEVHNAFNDIVISELTACFDEVGKMENVRVVVLRGRGKSFCAGADLNYMKGIAQFGYRENFEDGKRLANLFETVYSCPKPTIAVVHGAAFGGANGLLAACDIVIAEENTTFAFSEVKIGISPATIGPYVLKRIGEYGGKELMMTGKRFKGKEAEKFGLVNKSVSNSELETVFEEYIKQFMTAAPKAVEATKEMINKIVENKLENPMEYTADLIAKLRAADEGQEGMAAFLEKRRPGWVK
ncbi:MAG: enoyl-CoA hydratase/isomerase family protein [Bacteroidetes bacterium]|nr:MAG: enoyl-CoA hydratase/isomerase family protein [Bacteroidota bacterium]